MLAADKVAERAHELPLPPPEQQKCEVAARTALIRERARTQWRERWINGSNSAQYRELAPTVTHHYMRLHKNRPKPHSSLLTQLRTGKVGFNQFLCQRRVPGVWTATCDCGQGRMTVKHVLLACSKWRNESIEIREKAKTTNLKKLLSTHAGATAAIRMVLTTGLLSQFQATELPEYDKEEENS